MTKPGRPRQSEGRDLPCNGGGIWCEVAHPGRSHLGCPLAPFTAAAPPPQGPSVLPVLVLTPPELPCLVPGNWPLLPRLCHCDRISLSPLPVPGFSLHGWLGSDDKWLSELLRPPGSFEDYNGDKSNTKPNDEAPKELVHSGASRKMPA